MLAWERQESESTRAYEAYSLYRDMGAARSLAKVAQTLGKSKALMERWSAKHDWVGRTKALEARDEMLRREAVEEHTRSKAHEFAERRARIQAGLLENAELALAQERKMLEWPLTTQRVEREDEDGERVTYVFTPAGWSKATAATMHNLAASAVTGAWSSDAEGEPEEEWDFGEWTDEELREYIRLAEKLGIRREGSDR